jgi:hypothetical protein
MNETPLKTGICKYCAREVRLKKDGTMHRHGFKYMIIGQNFIKPRAHQPGDVYYMPFTSCRERINTRRGCMGSGELPRFLVH